MLPTRVKREHQKEDEEEAVSGGWEPFVLAVLAVVLFLVLLLGFFQNPMTHSRERN